MDQLDEEFLQLHRSKSPKPILSKRTMFLQREKRWDKYTKGPDSPNVNAKRFHIKPKKSAIQSSIESDSSIEDIDRWNFGDTYNKLREIYNSLDEVLYAKY